MTTSKVPPPIDSANAEQAQRDAKQRAMENAALVQLFGIIRPHLFPLGRVVATPGAIALIERTHTDATQLLNLHGSGQWGVVSDHDIDANEYALQVGARLMSVYELGEEKTPLWIITEADRSVTTLLLPQEY